MSLDLNNLGTYSTIFDKNEVIPFIEAIFTNYGKRSHGASNSLKGKMYIKTLRKVYAQKLDNKMIEKYFIGWDYVRNDNSMAILNNTKHEVSFIFYIDSNGETFQEVQVNNYKLGPTPVTLGQFIEMMDLLKIELFWKVPPDPAPTF